MGKMFFTFNGIHIQYGETDGIDAQRPTMQDVLGEEPDDNTRKNVAGVDPSLLFAAFSSSDKNSEGYPELQSKDEIEALSYGAWEMHDHYVTKYTKTNRAIVSDSMVPSQNSEKTRARSKRVGTGEQDQNAIRGLCIDAPMYMAGFGMETNGTMFGTRRVGPFDHVWNDNRKMWEARHAYPAAGKVLESVGNSLYKVAIFGAVRDEADPDDLTKLTASKTILVGEGQKVVGEEVFTRLDEVFHINEESGSLAVDDIVTVFYDGKNDIYTCFAGGGAGSAAVPEDPLDCTYDGLHVNSVRAGCNWTRGESDEYDGVQTTICTGLSYDSGEFKIYTQDFLFDVNGKLYSISEESKTTVFNTLNWQDVT